MASRRASLRAIMLFMALILVYFNLRITTVSSDFSTQPAVLRAANTPGSGKVRERQSALPVTGESTAASDKTRSASLAAAPARTSLALPIAATATAAATETAAESACPSARRPYHVLLTASSGAYQAWQSKIFYYHYLRLKRLNPCSDIGGFTRLLTLPAGQPLDELAKTMRTVTATELKKGSEDLGFVVLNRPHSLRDVLRRGALAHIEEEHIFITETDHILLKPLP